MEVTEKVLEKAKGLIKVNVSDEILKGLLANLPDVQMMSMVLPMMAEALKDVPEGTDAAQAVALVMKKMKKKGEGKSESAPGNAKQSTRAYFDGIWLEQRLMDAQIPTMEMQLYGETFRSPIMTAALSHLKTFNPDVEDAMVQYAKAAARAGYVHWVGMGENEEFARIMETGARTIRIIKPYADEEKIYSQIHFAEERGALAVGMDIDHTFTEEGNIDVVMGEEMAIKSNAVLRSYVQETKLPFVIKGVLSVHDAAACAEIGAKGIVVSHHGGRMNYAVPPLMVLPEIVKEVGKVMPVFVDCGICSGADAYKAMALGATAVGVGTHLIPYLRKGGADAVRERMEDMTRELKGFMANTGVKDVESFDATVVHMWK